MPKKIVDLATSSRNEENVVLISELLERDDEWNDKAKEVNRSIEGLGENNGTEIIKHGNIKGSTDLNNSQLHLNRRGVSKLAKNFIYFLRSTDQK